MSGSVSMFGTIGRFHPRTGAEEDLRALSEEWSKSIRERVPGVVVRLEGRSAERAGEVVIAVLIQDEETYRTLAALPEQDAWYSRLVPSEASMLRALVEAEEPLSRDELAERAGISRTSSGLGNGIRQLVALGLAQTEGARVRAAAGLVG